MINLPAIFLLMLLVPFAHAQGNSDTVNERIPVKKIEMEAHWKVDCQRAWGNLQATQAPAGDENCGISTQLLHEIQLCGFIYQAPGEQSQQACPDYQNAVKLLNRVTTPEQCHSALAVMRQEQLLCRARVGSD